MKNKDEAKYQYYIPKVYLKVWCFSNNSVWYYDKYKMNKEILTHYLFFSIMLGKHFFVREMSSMSSTPC